MGGPETIDIYAADIGGDLLGWATFPQSYESSSTGYGVVLLTDSMPGGAAEHPCREVAGLRLS